MKEYTPSIKKVSSLAEKKISLNADKAWDSAYRLAL